MTFPAIAVEKPLEWPLHNINIIKSENYGWSEKFFSYSANTLSIYQQQGEKTLFKDLHELSVSPQFSKHFPLLDVNVITTWNNISKKMEILVFDKDDKLLVEDMIKLDDRVDDVQVRFGQGRRPAFLFIKNSKNEYGASLWFDDREQVIFLQNTPIMAYTLDWARLSAYIVSRDGTKPVIKLWQKGLVTSFELPFMPVFAQFIDVESDTILVAIDGKSTLWSMQVKNSHLIINKILSSKELTYVKKLDVLNLNDSSRIIMQAPAVKKLLSVTLSDFISPGKAVHLEEFSLMSDDSIYLGKVSGKLVWLESNLSNFTYLINPEEPTSPVHDLTWKISTQDGYPEIFFSWNSKPLNKKYEYRYIIDNKEDSIPLPEYRIKGNKLSVKLAAQGNYFLHIQARDTTNGSESVVYHFPVFWKYRPPTPEISLTNEITPYVVSGNSIIFVINNIEPLDYFAEINMIPVYDPVMAIHTAAGEVQLNQQLKPGRYYLHIRSRDPKTNSYSATLHYLFFYQTYVTEYTVGVADYNKDLGRLNSLINLYKNAQTIEERDKILKELETFKQNIESEIENNK